MRKGRDRLKRELEESVRRTRELGEQGRRASLCGVHSCTDFARRPLFDFVRRWSHSWVHAEHASQQLLHATADRQHVCGGIERDDIVGAADASSSSHGARHILGYG